MGASMPHTVAELEELRRRLAISAREQASLEIRLLPDAQMVIFKNMIPTPAAEGKGKQETLSPGASGYRIYVAYRTRDEYAAAVAGSQRMLGPAAQPVAWRRGMALGVSPAALDQEWRLLNSEGRVVTVSVTCGSERVVGEVNAILAEVEQVLLAKEA